MNQLLRDIFIVFHQPYLKLLSFSCANTLILSQYPQISNSFQIQIPESYVNNIGVKLKSCLILSLIKQIIFIQTTMLRQAQNTFPFQKGQVGKEKYESQVSPKSNWENNNVLSLFLFDVGFHTAQGGHELSMQ